MMFGSFRDLAFMGAALEAPPAPGLDPDAAAYIAAVEDTDGQALEAAVVDAIDAFVVGCKADGIWTAIKASCILAGARTLAGALVPLWWALPRPASTSWMVTTTARRGWWGMGARSIWIAIWAHNADPQNNCHLSYWQSTNSSISANIIGTTNSSQFRLLTGGFNTGNQGGRRAGLCQSSLNVIASSGTWTGLNGASRGASDSYTYRGGAINYIQTVNSTALSTGSIFVFTVNASSSGTPDASYSNARLAFYSIGESLDLALLDARVTALINAFDTAIPS
jgi:hypothetical protein